MRASVLAVLAIARRRGVLAVGVLPAVALVSACGSSATFRGQRRTAGVINPSQNVAAGWSTLNLTNELGGDQISLISCTSGRFCMILAYNQQTPGSKAIPYYSGQLGHAVAVGGDVYGGVSLACASSRFCMLLTQTKEFYVWDGLAWSGHEGVPGAEGNAGVGLTCPSDGFCLAIGEDGTQGAATVLQYRSSTWSEQAFNSAGQVLNDITCSSASYCYLLGNDGDAWRFNGSTWGEPVRLTVPDGESTSDVIDEISCAAGPYCMAVGGLGGGVLLDRGSGFKPLPGVVLYNESAVNIRGACGSATFCLVRPLGSRGPAGYAILNGTHLSSVPSPATPPNGILLSCTSDRFCMNTTGNGTAVVTYSAE